MKKTARTDIDLFDKSIAYVCCLSSYPRTKATRTVREEQIDQTLHTDY